MEKNLMIKKLKLSIEYFSDRHCQKKI